MFHPSIDVKSDVETIPIISFPLRGRYVVENDLLNENRQKSSNFRSLFAPIF